MGTLSNLLWMLGFHAIIHQVQAYANGFELDHATICNSMAVIHKISNTEILPQPDPIPFEVQTIQTGPRLVTVTLKGNDGKTFTGFMLEARKKIDDRIVGTFLNIDSQSYSLKCNGVPNSGVSQKTNNDKTSVSVQWTSDGSDVDLKDVIFRITVVEVYDTFWRPADFNVTIPSPQPSTTPDITTTKTTVPASQNSLPPTTVNKQQMEIRKYSPPVTAIISLSSFVLILPLSFPNNAIYYNINMWIRIVGSVSIVSLAVSASALVLEEDSLDHVDTGLVFTLMVITIATLGLLIYVCLKIRRSHELKDICDIIFVFLIIFQKAFAIAFIYHSTKQCQPWLLGVVVAFTVYTGLQIIYYINFIVIAKVNKVTDARNKTGMPKRYVYITALLAVLHFALCIAIIVGICQC